MRQAVAVFWLVTDCLSCAAATAVYAATEIAIELGISSMIIGLTIVAVGTSLPELAATVDPLKGQPDIAIGNIGLKHFEHSRGSRGSGLDHYHAF